MSEKYPGGLITKTPVTPAGPYQTGAASGVWTRDQQLQYQQQGIWPTAGLTPPYIEDVFSTWLYTGNGSTQTITNNIDLTSGGLLWTKQRSTARANALLNTSSMYYMDSGYTGGDVDGSPVWSISSTGFSLLAAYPLTNSNNGTYATWAFKKKAKFFDVVTWTGDDTTGRQIPHNLGSVPACVFVKITSSSGSWLVYHQSIGTSKYLVLNLTDASANFTNWISVTSTSFTVNSRNASGSTYVAYLFASDAGGFGAAGTDNVITCGGFTTSSYYATVNLGYEPQWILYKRTDSTTDGDWQIADNMRGLLATANSPFQGLQPNLSNAESSVGNIQLTSTGFVFGGAAASPYIYIAIRRGPMKTPTDATTVYKGIARTGTGATANVTGVGFPVDLNWSHIRDAAYPNVTVDRLRGTTITLKPSTADAEAVSDTVTSFASMDGVQYGTSDRVNASGNTYVNWYFKRAPSFFDEVCYTADSSPQTVSHNLGVAPELILLKSRSGSGSWATYCAYFPTPSNNYKPLNSDYASTFSGSWGAMTSSTFIVDGVNYPAATTAVAYLFATCAGVSKVGSYTGNGTTQTINCGFGAGGARFVLITKSTVLSTGGWYVYDTARGMTVLTDPYLFMNVDAAESATLGSVTTVTTGFAVNASILAAINTNAATYIYLAIA